MDHLFTAKIRAILTEFYGNDCEEIFEKSTLLLYINIKTKSANKGSKSRGSFANLYAIYVLLEDYVKNRFNKKEGYSAYQGSMFSILLKRQRELPFGSKLQNHALNHRMNEEYKKFFPTSQFTPILRNPSTNRYWFNDKLLKVSINSGTYDISEAILAIIDEYIKTKMESFNLFIDTCKKLEELSGTNPSEIEKFISGLLAPHSDARLFEIVAYAILKYYYHNQKLYFGFEIDKLNHENLKLYKTGRTNANDGGIDYVMRPLGRFFQVTETLDVKKYFLDIDKIEKYPLTFVIKSTADVDELYKRLKEGAEKQYAIIAIVEGYMASVEEVINIPILQDRFKEAVKLGYLKQILEEIIIQSRVEFNYEEEIAEEEEEDVIQ
jgi:hypothetical protein